MILFERDSARQNILEVWCSFAYHIAAYRI